MTETRPQLRGLFAAAALLAGLGAARAEDGGTCPGYGDLKDRPDLAIARVVGPAARTSFVKNASEVAACPAATPACRQKAFLVPGNVVIAGATRAGFTCVDYIGAKGQDRAGWVASTGLARTPVTPVAAADWLGRWIREEASVTLKPGPKTLLAIHGDATWGAMDPDRVKRGAVNIGEIDGAAAPEGADLAFDVGDKATLPVDQGDAGDCKVWMRRLGPYLLVDDNLQCGGMNVSFRGIYRKAP